MIIKNNDIIILSFLKLIINELIENNNKYNFQIIFNVIKEYFYNINQINNLNYFILNSFYNLKNKFGYFDNYYFYDDENINNEKYLNNNDNNDNEKEFDINNIKEEEKINYKIGSIIGTYFIGICGINVSEYYEYDEEQKEYWKLIKIISELFNYNDLEYCYPRDSNCDYQKSNYAYMCFHIINTFNLLKECFDDLKIFECKYGFYKKEIDDKLFNDIINYKSNLNYTYKENNDNNIINDLKNMINNIIDNI